MMKRLLAVVAVFMGLGLGALVMPTQAQGGILNYDTGVTSSLSASAPLTFFSFQGSTGDRVTIQAIALTPGFQVVLSMIDSSGQTVASSAADPLNPGGATTRLVHRLPGDGVYSVIVSSLNGSFGDFALRLDGIPTTSETPVTPGEPSSGEAGPGTSMLVYTIPADPEQAQLATVSTSTAGTNFLVEVINPMDIQTAYIPGGDLMAASVNLPANEGTYTLQITVNNTTGATISVDVAPIGEAAPTDDTEEPTEEATPDIAPEATEEVSPASEDVTGTPTATATSTLTPTATNTLAPGVTPSATQTPSATPSATATSVQPTSTSTSAPTSTATPSATSVQPTNTYTPSPTPSPTTAQATATYTPSYTPTTPPPPPVAPEDARFNEPLNIPLDQTVSTTDFVSYPDGDREDRVRYSVTGMNPNAALSGGRARLVIAVSCFGTGTDQIQFFTGGQTYSCGQTLIDREVTADSDTGSIVITAVGGEGTYVQWVLTGTATRIN